jgi:copper transport protein
MAVAAMAAAGLAIVVPASPAWAHAQLVATAPPAGAVLPRPPTVVVLTFGEPVEIPLGSMEVLDATGRRVDSGGPFHPNGTANQVAEALRPDLPPSGYVVTWRVISADSHPVHGAFTFIVGAGSSSAAAHEARQLSASEAGSRTVGWLFGAIRTIDYGSVAVWLGGVALVALAWPRGRQNRRLAGLIWSGWAGAGLATTAAIAVQGPYGAGRPLSDIGRLSLVSATLHTRFGQLALVRLIVLLVVGAFLTWRLFDRDAASPDDPPSPIWMALAAATALIVLGTFSLSGHAREGGNALVGTVVDLVHIGAACLWVGGLAVLGVAALGRSAPAPIRTVLVFSQWALASAAAIALTGVIAAWRQVGSLAALTGTDYGRLVLAKSGAFLVLVALGAVSRRRAHGAWAVPGWPHRSGRSLPVEPADPSGAVRLRDQTDLVAGRAPLRRTVVVELVVAAGVLVLTSLLVNAQPARQAYVPAISTATVAGPTRVRISIPEARSGPVDLQLQTESRATGQPLAVPEVDANLSLLGTADGAVDNLGVQLRSDGNGLFSSVALDIPIPGKWELNLTVRTDEVDEYYANPVTIRFR